jgi:UDP-glucose 4-epimerase
VFNVGSDRSISIQELANLVIKVTASTSRVRAIPYADAFASGFEDLRQRKPDLTRIQRVIGFSPTIPLERTIEDVARSLKSAGGRPTP